MLPRGSGTGELRREQAPAAYGPAMADHKSGLPQSSCTPTPIRCRRGYPTVPSTQPYGAGVDPARVPRSILVELHHAKGLMIIAQQLPHETWRRGVGGRGVPE